MLKRLGIPLLAALIALPALASDISPLCKVATSASLSGIMQMATTVTPDGAPPSCLQACEKRVEYCNSRCQEKYPPDSVETQKCNAINVCFTGCEYHHDACNSDCPPA